MPKSENQESKTTSARPRKKSSGASGASVLRSVIAGAAATEGLFEIVERLGLVDMAIDRVKERVDKIDLDELLDDARDYLKRNPEVLVVTLGALTIASGVIVYLNARREWEGDERRLEQKEPKKAKGRSKTQSKND